ncbi:DUF2922 domain-containing protein [Moorella sulfitireducens]|uniref:DUF2922 domain-containing protein n=1 Tax=Neomoorella sulfitireducens TaxID=2972948 RepID=UPI003BF4B8D0
MTKTLQLIFGSAAGRQVTLSMADPRDNLTEAEVRAVMQLILDKNIFTSCGGDLVTIAGARIVTRDVTDIIAA